jgi:acyl-CoA synthetase (AMP-forming)/AMP-acid ligase II
MPHFTEQGTLGEFIERNMREHARASALRFKGQTWTHSEFGARCCQMSNALYDRGLRRQERVAVLAQNSNAYLEIYGACEIAGFILVTVNYRLAPAEINFILKDSAPSAVIFDEEYANVIAELRSDLSDVRRYICIGSSKPEWADNYEAVLNESSSAPPPIGARPEDIAYLIYTSGSTGRPKGAMLAHQGVVQSAELRVINCPVTSNDRGLIVMPLYHIGAKATQLTLSSRAAEIILLRNYNTEEIAATIERHRITFAHFAPIMIQDLMDVADAAKYDLSSLRLINYASAPMSVANLRRAIEKFGSIFMQIYGMTETGGGTALLPWEHVLDGKPEVVRRLASAGRPAPAVRIKVVRPNGEECDVEEPGEILFSTVSHLVGYWNNHLATLAAIKDGWFHTGDIGFLDSEGYLFVSDRKKDMIISGGENIYPREVEEAIYRHPAVLDAAVIGVPDDRWGEAVKAFIVLRPGFSATEGQIVEHCRQLIASYKKPKSVEFVTNMPRLANLKIDKKQLRSGFWEGKTRQVN